jgi:hypothetical protein
VSISLNRELLGRSRLLSGVLGFIGSGAGRISSGTSSVARSARGSIASGSSGITRSISGITRGISSFAGRFSGSSSGIRRSFLLRAGDERQRQRERGKNHFCVHVIYHPDGVS